MAAGFHATGSRGFQRTTRRVEPNVAARDHLPRHMHIIILDKDEPPLQIAIFAQVNDVLDITLAIVIARMGFAGKNELDRPGAISCEPHDILELLKDQQRAFIGDKSSREYDGLGIRIEQLIEGNEVTLAQTLALQQQTPAG